MQDKVWMHIHRVKNFEDYCKTRGWVSEPSKGEYEILRLTHPEMGKKIHVYRSDKKQGACSTFGVGAELARQFLQLPSNPPADIQGKFTLAGWIVDFDKTSFLSSENYTMEEAQGAGHCVPVYVTS